MKFRGGRVGVVSGAIVCLVALAPSLPTPAAAAPSPPKHGSTTWHPSGAVGHRVVVSQLPKVTVTNVPQRPLFVKDPAAYAAAKSKPTGASGAAALAPRSIQVGAPPLAASFAGISLASEKAALGIGGSIEPPDTQMAVGPTSIFELTNIAGQVYDKTGVAVGTTFSLATFFLIGGGFSAGDPRVLYDPVAGRFYATMLGFNPSTFNSEVQLAVSMNTDPTGTWTVYTVYTATGQLCDQAKPGYSDDKIVIACSDFSSPSSFTGGVIIVVSKTEAIAGALVPGDMGFTSPQPSLFGMVPTQGLDAGTNAYIALNGGSVAGLISTTGDPHAPGGINNVNLTITSIPMAATSIPPRALQSGSGVTIDTGDDRFMSAVLQGGSIWTSTTTGCTPGGDSAVRACIRLIQISLVGPTMVQDFTTGATGKYLFYPSLAVDASKNVVIDYSESSASEFPSHSVAIEPQGTASLSLYGVVQSGAGAYTGTRWGDYGAAGVDPAVAGSLWFAGEYSAQNSTTINWGTGIGELQFTTIQLSVTGLGFGQLVIGATSPAQALTVTNTGTFAAHIGTAALNSGATSQFHVVDNNCPGAVLAPSGTCTAHFTFTPTSTGDKEARFNVSGPDFGPLSLVLTGIGVGAACASTGISTDLSSPQNVGANVTLSATSLGCPNPNPLFKFLLRSPEGIWTTVRDFNATNTWVWNTAGYEKGTYLIGVWVKDTASTNTYDAYAFGTFTLALPSCSSVNVASDVASPQVVGTTVNFTASSIGCPSPRYQWFVRDTAGNWKIVPGHDFANSSTTFAWNTSALTEGTYQVGVWVKQVGSLASYDAFAFVTYTLTVGGGHCAVPQLAPGVASPQAAGSSILFTASSTGCTSPLYRFYVRDLAGTWHIVQDFSPVTTYNWTPASPVSTSFVGTYLVGIWAKSVGSSKTYDDFYFLTYTLTIGTPCTVNIAAAPGTGATAGTPVTWTATALNCTGGAKFRFWVNPPGGSFGIVQDYSTTNTYPWTQSVPGTYQVGVWVLQTGSTKAYDAFAFTTFTLTPTSPSQVCSSANVSAAPPSPSLVSTAVTLTATSIGCDTPKYRWWVRDTAANWAIVQDYTVPGNTFNWSTSGLLPGTYLVGVWARQSGSTASYEAYSFITYTLTAPPVQVCSSVGISPNVASPQNVGTSVTFTATAAGCGTPDYRFFIAPPGGAFGEVQPFGPPNTFIWNTNSLAPGPYQVGVWARQHGSTAAYEAFAFITFQLQRASVACVVLDLNTDLGQLLTQGTTVNILVAAVTGCGAPEYQFYVRSPGSASFVVVQPYSATPQYSFVTTTKLPGAYTFLVLARAAGSSVALDTYAETDLYIL